MVGVWVAVVVGVWVAVVVGVAVAVVVGVAVAVGVAMTHPLITLVRQVNFDLTSAKAKLSEVERQIAAMNLAPAAAHRCSVESCGLTFRNSYKLAEHVFVSHDGPEPEHWIAAEARSLEPPSQVTSGDHEQSSPLEPHDLDWNDV